MASVRQLRLVRKKGRGKRTSTPFRSFRQSLINVAPTVGHDLPSRSVMGDISQFSKTAFASALLKRGKANGFDRSPQTFLWVFQICSGELDQHASTQ